MSTQNLFLSLDWGTTAFRLRLVEIPSLHVLGEESSKEGIAAIHDAWKKAGGDENTRFDYYAKPITETIKKLEAATGKALSGIPLVISGMASSTLGIKEVPYGDLPFAIDGSDLKTESMPESPQFPHRTLLISGIKSSDDVMRGEEVQVVGCRLKTTDEEQIIVHPGTHCKHIVVKAGKAVSFRTFMSGEVFGLLSQQSILAASVAEGGDFDQQAQQHFAAGVKEGANGPLLHCIFKVRTGDLFHKRSREQSFHYLSGLVIGAELSAFPEGFKGPIVLAGEAALLAQYKIAMEALAITQKAKSFVMLDATDITLAGQYEVFRRQQK